MATNDHLNEFVGKATEWWWSCDCFANAEIEQNLYNQLYTTAMYVIVVVVLAFVVDNVVVRMVVKKEARWFMLHVLFNAWITFMSAPNAWVTVTDPLNALDSPYEYISQLTTAAIGGFHLYHTLMYDLTTEDILHHLISTCLVVAVGVLCPFGSSLALVNFIMCGLPGGIDYFLLVLVKHGLIDKMTEKDINRFLNLLIRWPGMFLAGYLMFLNAYHGRFDPFRLPTTTIVVMVMAASAHTANAAYYCQKVVGNHAIVTHLNSHTKKTSQKKQE